MGRLLQKASVEKTCHINAIKIYYQETRTQATKPEGSLAVGVTLQTDSLSYGKPQPS
jgi:hypothetical protein